MKKIFTLFLIILLFIGSFTLKDYSEIEQVAIASVIFIEENNDGFTLTAQIVNQLEENKKTAVASGKDLNECIERLNSTLIKKLSLSHCAVTVISVRISSKALGNILNTLKDYNKFPLSSNIILAESFNKFTENDTDYSLSEYLINKNHSVPLYAALRDAYDFKKVNLPIIKHNSNGFEVIGNTEKEVVF